MAAQIINGVVNAELDGLVKQLTSIVVAAQDFSAADQKRFTDFVLAAGSLMLARTRLGPGDQKIFEDALHEAAAARKNGH